MCTATAKYMPQIRQQERYKDTPRMHKMQLVLCNKTSPHHPHHHNHVQPHEQYHYNAIQLMDKVFNFA